MACDAQECDRCENTATEHVSFVLAPVKTEAFQHPVFLAAAVVVSSTKPVEMFPLQETFRMLKSRKQVSSEPNQVKFLLVKTEFGPHVFEPSRIQLDPREKRFVCTYGSRCAVTCS